MSGKLPAELAGVSKLIGRFSSETEMTASEVNTYPLAAGGTVVYTWEWKATPGELEVAAQH